MALPDVDLHLLRCLDVLVSERHVTRSAERLGMTQSGTSTALARLRNVFNDPILVRTPKGMQLSENALEIAGAARRAINEIELAIARRGPFEPATSSATFSVMASDYVAVTIMPLLIERLGQLAPNMIIKLVPPEPSRIRESLANSEVDLVIGYFHDIAEGLYQTVLFKETLVCVLRAGHPLVAGEVSIGTYADTGHIYYGSPPAMVSSIENLLERTLSALGVERRIGFYSPTLAVIPHLISRSNLLATIPAVFANSFAEQSKLQVLPLPFDVPKLPVSAIWHERMHDSHAHRWLRSVLQELAHRSADSSK